MSACPDPQMCIFSSNSDERMSPSPESLHNAALAMPTSSFHANVPISVSVVVSMIVPVAVQAAIQPNIPIATIAASVLSFACATFGKLFRHDKDRKRHARSHDTSGSAWYSCDFYLQGYPRHGINAFVRKDKRDVHSRVCAYRLALTLSSTSG